MPTYEQCLELLNNAPAFISPEPPSAIRDIYSSNISPLPAPTNFSVLPLGRSKVILYWQESQYPQAGWNTAARRKYRVTFTHTNAVSNERKFWIRTFNGTHELTCAGDCSCSISPVREYAEGYFYCVIDFTEAWATLPTHGTFSVTLQSLVMAFKQYEGGRRAYRQLTSLPATATTIMYDFPFAVYNLKYTILSGSDALVTWAGEPTPGLISAGYRVGLQNENGSWSVIYTGPNTSIQIPRFNDRSQTVRVTALYTPEYNNGNLAQLINNFTNYSPFGLIPSKLYIGSGKTYLSIPDKSVDPAPPTINNVILSATSPNRTLLFVSWKNPTVFGALGIKFNGSYIEYGISNNPSSWTRSPIAYFGQRTRLTIPERSTQGISIRMVSRNSSGTFSSYSDPVYIATP